MTDLIEMVEAMTSDMQAVAARVLDAVSRPLTLREIKGALRKHRVSRSRAVLLGASLKGFAVVAVVGPEGGGGFAKV